MMTFETLKKYHLSKIKVVLKTGEEYIGVITSHDFMDTDRVVIDRISLLGDTNISKIKCEDIQSISFVDENV
jgi:small nuclear ribonucleoprotein (snRNP)-like protein